MSYLLEAHDEIQRDVFWNVRNLFNLVVDVLFIDIISTYFEIEGEDPADEQARDDDGDGDGGERPPWNQDRQSELEG